MSRIGAVSLASAQRVCRALPPLVAQQARVRLLPPEVARASDEVHQALTVNGVVFVGRLDDFQAYPTLVNGYYDWRNVAVAQALVPVGGTIVEVGANVGSETAAFAGVVGPSGTVVACEPVPDNLVWLQELAARNPSLTIEVHPTAVGDRDGEVEFLEPPRSISGEGHVVLPGAEEAPPDGWRVRTVAVRRLDDLLAGAARVDMLCVDTEGHEPQVLDGAAEVIARCRPSIVLEADGKHLRRKGTGTLASLEARLTGWGYVCFEIGRYGLRPLAPHGEEHPCNWLALPTERADRAKAVTRQLRRSLLAPPIAGLSPLARRVAGDG